MKIDPEMGDLFVFTPENLPPPVERRNAMVPMFAEAVAAAIVPQGMEATNRTIPGPSDNPQLAVRIYRPAASGPQPILLYFHGGGFTLGNLDSEHIRCMELATGGECIVISVDYRLSPENSYPAAFDDGYAALEWIAAEGKSIGADVNKIAVGGCSAGGCLAAAVAIASRDRKGPAVCFQFLSSPVLDDRLETPSMRTCTDVPIFARFQAERMWKHYLGKLTGEPPVYAAPARVADVRGLPPAYILACGLDPLRDEAVQYGCRLLADGIPVEMHAVPNVPHAFDLIQPTASRSQAALAEMQRTLRKAFA